MEKWSEIKPILWNFLVKERQKTQKMEGEYLEERGVQGKLETGGSWGEEIGRWNPRFSNWVWGWDDGALQRNAIWVAADDGFLWAVSGKITEMSTSF